MKVSKRIFEIMEQKNITQKELAEGAKIGQSTISDWHTKKTDPSANKIMAICRVLDVTPEDLLQYTE